MIPDATDTAALRRAGQARSRRLDLVIMFLVSQVWRWRVISAGGRVAWR
jgi:hypothetical protein